MAEFSFASAPSDRGTALRQQQVSRQRVERAIEILSQQLTEPPTLVELGREVAIKVLPASIDQDTDRVARFHREARLLASLNHPHIAAAHG